MSRYARPMLALLLLLPAAMTAQTISGYFGPVKATVGSSVSLPISGEPYAAPNTLLHAEWGGSGARKDACVTLLDPYGSLGSPFVEFSTHLAYTSLYAAWKARTHLAIAWGEDSSPTCDFLLEPGTCIQVSGYILADRDLFGRTYVADAVTYPASCP